MLLEAPIPDVDGEVDGAGAEALVGGGVGDGIVCNEAVEDALLELGEVGVDLEGAGEDSLDLQLKACAPAINLVGCDGRSPN